MPALMTISQPTPGASPADSSKRDGLSTEVVTVTLSESGTIEFMAVPPGVTTPSIAGGPTVYTFTPAAGVTGHKYIIRSTATSDGSFSRRTFGIPHVFSGLILPAWNEIGDPDGADGSKTDAVVIDASDDNALDSVYTTGNPTGWTRDVHEMGAHVNALVSAGYPMLKWQSASGGPLAANVFEDEALLRAAINATPGPKIIELHDDLELEGDIDLNGCFFKGNVGHAVTFGEPTDLLNKDDLLYFGFSNCEAVFDNTSVPWDLGVDPTTVHLEGSVSIVCSGGPIFRKVAGRMVIAGVGAIVTMEGWFFDANESGGLGTADVEIFCNTLIVESDLDEWITATSTLAGTSFTATVTGNLLWDDASAPVGAGGSALSQGQMTAATGAAGANWDTASIRRLGNSAGVRVVPQGVTETVPDGDHGLTVFMEYGSTWVLPDFADALTDGIGEIKVVADRNTAPNSQICTIDFNGQTVNYARNESETEFSLDTAGMVVTLRPVNNGEWNIVDVYEPGVVYLKGIANGESVSATWAPVGPYFYLEPDTYGQSYHIWDNDDSRVRLGISSGSGTAQLRLVRDDGTVMGEEWENTGAVGDANLPDTMEITTDGWYQFELREADATGTATLDGVDLRIIPVTSGF